MSASPSPEPSRPAAGGSTASSGAARSGTPADVRHEPDANRFALPLGDTEAVAEYSRRGDTIVFTHTEVPSAHEGQGIGGRLARAAMEHARAEGLRVIPQCPFIASWVNAHPDFHDVVHPEFRARLEG